MIRFYNGRVLTLDDSRENEFEIFEGYEVWIDGSTIYYCGESREDSKNFSFEREIDLKGNLLMPSFKNAHTHSAMTFARSFSDDLPLDKWLNDKIFPMEARLCGDDIEKLSRIAFLGIYRFLFVSNDGITPMRHSLSHLTGEIRSETNHRKNALQ